MNKILLILLAHKFEYVAARDQRQSGLELEKASCSTSDPRKSLPDRFPEIAAAIALGDVHRFAATHPDAIRGVIVICGGLPDDWGDGAYQPVTARVLHIARSGNQYHPPSVTDHYAERLRRRGVDVEFHLVGGGHQMPSDGGRIVSRGCGEFWYPKNISGQHRAESCGNKRRRWALDAQVSGIR